jgi:2-polyprenyl-3-methyl-5-hydroxy-6-metoxy-1,4-benzoquinol methylase
MIKKFSKVVTKCQISNSKNLESLIFLGYLPPVNTLRKIGTNLEEEISFPAELLYCKKSKLAQLGCIVDKEILFPYSYPYTSSTTRILRENFADLYKDTIKIINLKKKDLIIDIGSNDGNLLSNFKNHHRVLGVTPEKIGKLAIKKGIPTIIDYFNNKTVKKILKNYGKARIITATNVFAHIDNINNIVKNILKNLDSDGIFISESHYLLPLIKTVQYDTIYHEHLRYYSVQSLNYLFKKHKLEIIDTKEISTHGGSIRIYAARKGKYKVSRNVKLQLQKENKSLNQKSFDQFKKNVVNSKIKLFNIIDKLKKNNKSIFGVGAPSRASTLINYLGLDQDIVDCVLEIDGSYKIGNYIPGTKIPILNENILKQQKPNYLLLFSWHIKDELKKNLRKKGFKGKFIIPLPYPKIEN